MALSEMVVLVPNILRHMLYSCRVFFASSLPCTKPVTTQQSPMKNIKQMFLYSNTHIAAQNNTAVDKVELRLYHSKATTSMHACCKDS
jgi:hypothetical protein